jgi:hypothetical protein
VRTLARVRWKRMAGTSICGARDARTPLSVGALWSEVVSPGGARDRVHFKTLGTARRGHPIEEIVRQAETGETTASRSNSSKRQKPHSMTRSSIVRPTTVLRCPSCMAATI